MLDIDIHIYMCSEDFVIFHDIYGDTIHNTYREKLTSFLENYHSLETESRWDLHQKRCL